MRVCHGLCLVRWTLDGKYLHVGIFGAHDSSPEFKTFIVPLRRGETFPELPASGIETEDDMAHLPGVKTFSGWAYPGPDGALRVQPPNCPAQYLSHSDSVGLPALCN